MTLSKLQRLAVFLNRLGNCAPIDSAAEAFALITTLLNDTKNELTDIPANPPLWQSDGRLYPPQADSGRKVPGRPDITRYISRRHTIWIGANGAIRVAALDGQLQLNKVGGDGRQLEL
jgi:hypothetical protein